LTSPFDWDKNYKQQKINDMYALRNKVQLIGNLGNAPEVKTLDDGKKIARFSMATNEIFRDRAGRKETETTWHNVVAWGKIAELAERYLTKGKEIAIEGKLVNRTYNDKDGIKRYVTEIVANELLLIGEKERA
jgi:single-strand DNA-binding protein